MTTEKDQLLSSYNYQLPEELIAQTPAVPRDSSRLLVVSPTSINHQVFRSLPQWLNPGDLLVFNNTRVIPARLYGRKNTGAPVEILLLEEQSHNLWLALVKPGKRFTKGATIYFHPPKQPNSTLLLKATVQDNDPATGGRFLQFDIPSNQSLLSLLDKFGEIPLPPYISDRTSTPEQYQTVYAIATGAVAAPTAGLHFTEELLQKLHQKGINQAFLTLHVGVGTFRPLEVENITKHHMHQEWVEVNESTVAKIEQTLAQGHRVIAVGTTVVRALESAAQVEGKLLAPFRGKTDLFIYPGYNFRVIDGLITNFHLPGSSLLMLVSALIGRERLLSIYLEAIAEKYRFYSFGDAMLILASAKGIT